jgi:hypothetical protein
MLQFIKTKIIFVLFIYKLLSLVDFKCLYSFFCLEDLPYGYYININIIDKIPFNFSFDLAYYNSLLEIDILFIIICLLIILITLNIYNLMIIFIFMISFYNYKIYRIFYIIRKILHNMKVINKWCKIFGFISINILKVCGFSVEEILLICNFNFNKIFEFYLSNMMNMQIMGMGNERQIITNSHNYNFSTSTSHNSLISSNSNKDNSIKFLLDQIHNNESDSSDSSDSNDSSDKLFITEFQKKEFKKLDFINFSDFNKDFNLEDKYLYLKRKFYNKGIDHNIPFLDWFVNLLNNTDGTKTNIDNIIEKNLNHILKIERETQLNNLAFFRNKPFLINKFDNSPIAYPNIIPLFKGLKY